MDVVVVGVVVLIVVVVPATLSVIITGQTKLQVGSTEK